VLAGAEAFQTMMAGKDHIFAKSMKTKLEGVISKVVPNQAGAEMHRKQAQPKERKSA
jgi:uncharacterized protein